MFVFFFSPYSSLETSTWRSICYYRFTTGHRHSGQEGVLFFAPSCKQGGGAEEEGEKESEAAPHPVLSLIRGSMSQPEIMT